MSGDIDARIAFAEELIAKRKELDRQLAELFNGKAPERKQRVCSRCNQPGHVAKTCTAEPPQPVVS